MDPLNRVLDGRARWRHMGNTVERLCTVAMNGSATRGDDAACSQISLGSFFWKKLRILKQFVRTIVAACITAVNQQKSKQVILLSSTSPCSQCADK